MRNALANLCQLAALVGVSTAAFLVWLPLGVLVASVAVGMVGVALDPSVARKGAK